MINLATTPYLQLRSLLFKWTPNLKCVKIEKNFWLSTFPSGCGTLFFQFCVLFRCKSCYFLQEAGMYYCCFFLFALKRFRSKHFHVSFWKGKNCIINITHQKFSFWSLHQINVKSTIKGTMILNARITLQVFKCVHTTPVRRSQAKIIRALVPQILSLTIILHLFLIQLL